MNQCVFLGPTMPAEKARELCSAAILPPVRQGDVYRVASLYRPAAIGIIDGYFNQVPAVWHKEILWALEHGIHVLGAASMGALRAAELEPFGMRGVGRVFEAYRDGFLAPDTDATFEDDDEVAVVHGPPGTGYLPVSEAMVNIRVTLAAAEEAGVISSSTRRKLVHIAKRAFYPERNYDMLLEAAAEATLPGKDIEGLRAWLPEGRVDQKQLDAMALLRLLPRINRQAGNPGLTVPLEYTSQWAAAKSEFDADYEAGSDALDELRLQGKAWFELREQARQRALGSEPFSPTATGSSSTGSELTACHGAPDRLDALHRGETRLRALETFSDQLPDLVINQHVTALLEASGELKRLEQRAALKRQRLADMKAIPNAADLSGLDKLQLQEWYFERHLGVSMPDDLEAYVASLAIREMDDFIQALIDEYYFSSREEKKGQAS